MTEKRTPQPNRNRTQANPPRAARTQQYSNDERRKMRALRAQKKLRRKKIIATVVGFSALLIIGIILCLTVFFNIAELEVVGDEIYNADEIIAASELEVGENMFLMQAKDACARLEKNLPYIEKATIKRHLSCKVTLQITAAKAVAAVPQGDAYILLNANGKVLENDVLALSEELLVLSAGTVTASNPGESIAFEEATAAQSYIDTMRALQENDISNITALDVTNLLNIRATYDHRIVLELGEASKLAEKADFVKATLERSNKNSPNFKGSIDFTIDKKAYQHAEKATTTVPASKPALQGDAA